MNSFRTLTTIYTVSKKKKKCSNYMNSSEPDTACTIIKIFYQSYCHLEVSEGDTQKALKRYL